MDKDGRQRQTERIQAEIAALNREAHKEKAREQRIKAAFEEGLYTLNEFRERQKEIKTRLKRLEREKDEKQRTIRLLDRQRFDQDKVYAALARMEEIIRFADERQQGEIIRCLFQEIVLKFDGTIEVKAVIPTEEDGFVKSSTMGSPFQRAKLNGHHKRSAISYQLQKTFNVQR